MGWLDWMILGRDARRDKALIQAASSLERLSSTLEQGLPGRHGGGQTDMDAILKRPADSQVVSKLFKLYRRDPLARRAVELPVQSVWTRGMEIVPTDDSDQAAQSAADDVNALFNNSSAINCFTRADRFLSLDKYSIIVVGVNSDKPMREPVEANSLKSIDDIVFFQAYPASQTRILAVEDNRRSARFGLPTKYEIASQAVHGSANKQEVHWSRVIHVVDSLIGDKVSGEPRLGCILNTLLDVQKTIGGSAEMFWQGADRTFLFQTSGDTEISPDAKEQIEAQLSLMARNLKRFVIAQNAEVSTLQTVQPDPRGNFEAQLQLIAAGTGIPVRILVGSERGELASSQDFSSFAAGTEDKRKDFAEPAIIRQTVTRLMQFGVIPVFEFGVKWPPAAISSALEQSQIAKLRADTAAILTGGVPAILLDDEQMKRLADGRLD